MEIVLGIEIDGNRNTSGGATSNEKGFGDFRVALRLGFPVLRGEIGAEIEKAAETSGRIHKSSGCEIQASYFELGIEGSEGSVLLVDGPGGSIELEFSASGKIGGDSHGKLGGHGKVFGHHAHVIVS